MIQPVPGGPLLHNLAATLLRHGNTAQTLGAAGISSIASHQGIDAGKLTRELARQEKLNAGGFEEASDK